MSGIRENRRRSAVLVTDIDGTFIDESAVPNYDVLVAAQKVIRMGVELVFATGRRPSSAQAVLGDLLHSAALVSLDGAVGHYQEYRSSYTNAFLPHVWSELATLSAQLEEASARLIIGDPLDGVVTSTWWEGRTMPLPHGRVGLEEFFDCRGPVPISRIELRRSTKTAEAMRSLAVRSWDATCLVRGAWWFLLPKGTSKESGVRRVIGQTVPVPLLVAVGDERNDLGLLRSADVAITVEGSVAASALPHSKRIRRPSEGGWSELPEILKKILSI